MSLDLSLINEKGEEVYSCNITHNLGAMAKACGLYKLLWRPEELEFTTAGEFLPYLRKGIAELAAYPTIYKEYHAENGWGTYDDFLPFVNKFIAACENNRLAKVEASR
jgi:hypothetical protein